MNKLIKGIAIGISLTVITFQIPGIINSMEPKIETVKLSTNIGVPLGLDTNGFAAACREDGTALSISSMSGVMTLEVRFNEGEPMRCMTKDEAISYMASIGADNSDIEEILATYPKIKRL